MKKMFLLLGVLSIALLLCIVAGCAKEKKPDANELLLGTWSHYRNKAHFILIIKAQGGWNADVRVEGATSKIIEKRGAASGTWQLVDKQLLITVAESDIGALWEKKESVVCDILELNKDVMHLQYDDGRDQIWKRAKSTPKGQEPEDLQRMIKMAPLVVNLNKLRSHDKDRYLCVDLELNLKSPLPDMPVPVLHPRAREAVILFLSSLIYKDVKTLDGVEQVTKNIEVMLNPYLDNQLDNIKVNHVVISSSKDKVQEFLIEHAPQPEPDVLPDQENEKGDK